MRHILMLSALIGLSTLMLEVHADGEKIYDDWCMICHAPTHNMPGSDRIREVYGEDRVDLKNSPFVNEQTIRILVREGRGMMPPFRRTEISNAELDELVAFLIEENSK